MSEYQIEWPSFSQRVERKKTKTRNKTSKAREFDGVDTSMSWLEVLDNVHNVISVVSNLSKVSFLLKNQVGTKLFFSRGVWRLTNLPRT